jgi:hypothetical protein
MNAACLTWRPGAAMLALAIALTLGACDSAYESVGRGMAESSARARAAHYEAQGNPQFADPQLAAVVRKFEADYASFGLDAGKLGAAGGRPCNLSPGDTFRIAFGSSPEQWQATQDEVSRNVPGHTAVADPESAKVILVSGTCGPRGPEGPAVVVTRNRSITRMKTDGINRVTVTDATTRSSGTWAAGRPMADVDTITIVKSAEFDGTAEGNLTEHVSDWAYLNEMAAAPSGVYTYQVPGPGGKPKISVTFFRNPMAGGFTTMVSERRDDHHVVTKTWQGTELVSESSIKDGKLHGWYVIHPSEVNGTTVPGRRDCYQNGELVKSLECPAT